MAMWSDVLDSRMSATDLQINRTEAEHEWDDEARVNCFIRFWFKYGTGKNVALSMQELRRKTEEMIGHSISDQAFQIGLYLADLEVKDRVKFPLWPEDAAAWWEEDLLRLENQIAEQK
jgi:uncharacterized protein YfiM (DUF2279 family)